MSESATRITPWTAIFGEARFAHELFPAIEEQASALGDATSFDAFLTLPAAGRLVHVLETGRDADAVELKPDAAHRYGRLVWHAWHFWRSGARVFPFDEQATRALLAEAPRIGSRRLQPLVPAGYAQVARNLIWARVDPGTHAEPLDGFFWLIERAGETVAADRLHVLLVLGLRDDRPGLSVIEAAGTLGEPDGHWGDVQARADGTDFDNILPGGELDGLHGLLNTAEALKLASRALLAMPGTKDGERK
ncbi:MAG: hypothetical protein L0271_00595 [Gemmatimonadetes bacterium]|nr:hypothetical protein [Gemmatimonadota bacterium]